MSGSMAELGWRRPPELPKGLDLAVMTVAGRWRRRGTVMEVLRRRVEEVESMAARYGGKTDHELREALLEMRMEFRRGGVGVDGRVTSALAALREASDRVLGLRPFPEQILGALALHGGYLAEMATGEGKTLTAGLAGVLAGWTRRPAHVLTVNDYLVARDARWLGSLYAYAGLRVGSVVSEFSAKERREGHAADVTYTTAKELLADFLRDRMVLGADVSEQSQRIRRILWPREAAAAGEKRVLRGLHTAIVDEADSLLIDEAVTPLIISMPRANPMLRAAVLEAEAIAGGLARGRDYEANARYREIEITTEGEERIAASVAGRGGMWRGPGRRVELVRQALNAREFFGRGQQYVVEKGKVVIVDEFTGRPMPQRSWRQGLHQAVEAKEGVELSDPAETVARLSFQQFFRCFHRLSGMTGTAMEAAGELWRIYELPTVRIPTHRPCVRERWPDRYFGTTGEKWGAIVESIQSVHATGRPVLVGTRSVAASERLGAMLEERGVAFRLLNATRLAEEASIIALAGERGCVTLSTNMAGRGTDIRLGAGVAELGGLHVIATEYHESGRVDRQLYGRSGRQGDPGSVQQFASADDELVVRHLPAHLRGWIGRRGDWVSQRLFRLAQARAQRLAYRQRQAVLRSDLWLGESLAFAPDGML